MVFNMAVLCEKEGRPNRVPTLSTEDDHQKRILPNRENPLKPLKYLLPETPLERACKGLAVTSFVAGYLNVDLSACI